MATHDPSTPFQAVFAVSRLIGAYPTTRKTMGYAIVQLCMCAVVVSAIVARNINSAANKPPTDTVSMILEHLESVEVSLLFFMCLSAVMAYLNHDIASFLRSAYHIHDCIFKLGIVPVYRGKPGIFVLLLSFAHVFTEYSLTIIKCIREGDFEFAVTYVACALSELVIHSYTTQFICLMVLMQDQMKAITSGLANDNQWYLESIVNVQCHLLQTTKYIYVMFVKLVSLSIVHSTIALMTHAFEITEEINYVLMALIAFELVVVFCLVDACGQLQFKVENFNSRLFKLMRLSKNLCQNNKLYVFLTSKQTVTFTACGFFKVNYSLVVSIIAAVTTYLVILVQLSKPQQPVKFD